MFIINLFSYTLFWIPLHLSCAYVHFYIYTAEPADHQRLPVCRRFPRPGEAVGEKSGCGERVLGRVVHGAEEVDVFGRYI